MRQKSQSSWSGQQIHTGDKKSTAWTIRIPVKCVSVTSVTSVTSVDSVTRVTSVTSVDSVDSSV
jgi:hypothetical protein